jgi:hypothetical protein
MSALGIAALDFMGEDFVEAPRRKSSVADIHRK